MAEMITPPITGMAMRFIGPAPGVVARRIGVRAMKSVRTVVSFGPTRSTAPSMTAVRSSASVRSRPLRWRY